MAAATAEVLRFIDVVSLQTDVHATEDCVESSEHDSTVALQVARHPSTGILSWTPCYLVGGWV